MPVERFLFAAGSIAFHIDRVSFGFQTPTNKPGDFHLVFDKEDAHGVNEKNGQREGELVKKVLEYRVSVK